jgi:hypothetical protein
MRAIKGGNVPENAFSIIEGGERQVQKTFKIVIKDLCLHNKINPGDMVHAYIRKLTEENAIDLGETRVQHDYRIALWDLEKETQIQEGEVVAVYLSKISPENKPVEIKKKHPYTEAGQRIVEKQGLIDLKDICKIEGIKYRDCINVYIRKSNEENAIPAGTRRILKKLQIVISDLCPIHSIKENDVVVVYIQKINTSERETEKKEIVIGSKDHNIALHVEGNKNVNTDCAETNS